MVWLVATAGAVDTADGCVPATCEVGDLELSAASCTAGETITLTATGCEGGAWSWADDAGTGGAFVGDGGQVTYTCPDVACPGDDVTIYAVAMDSCGNQDWTFGSIDVSCAPETDTGTDDKGAGPCGCASPASPALLPSLAALSLLRRRRALEPGARSPKPAASVS